MRASIEGILQKKGSARMDLERKIMKAGKRASESAVQRAFERHLEDIKEEQPLLDQKLDSENELKLRAEYAVHAASLLACALLFSTVLQHITSQDLAPAATLLILSQTLHFFFQFLRATRS
jgi:hypothetical protein